MNRRERPAHRCFLLFHPSADFRTSRRREKSRRWSESTLPPSQVGRRRSSRVAHRSPGLSYFAFRTVHRRAATTCLHVRRMLGARRVHIYTGNNVTRDSPARCWQKLASRFPVSFRSLDFFFITSRQPPATPFCSSHLLSGRSFRIFSLSLPPYIRTHAARSVFPSLPSCATIYKWLRFRVTLAYKEIRWDLRDMQIANTGVG